MGSENLMSPPKMSSDQPVSPGVSEENVAGGQNESIPRENFNFPPATASDLLTVTPQMIAQYLRPEPNTTNAMDRPGAVVFIPADMPFVPPPPRSSADSRASYHVK